MRCCLEGRKTLLLPIDSPWIDYLFVGEDGPFKDKVILLDRSISMGARNCHCPGFLPRASLPRRFNCGQNQGSRCVCVCMRCVCMRCVWGKGGVGDGPSLFHIPAPLYVENEISQNLRFLNATENYMSTFLLLFISSNEHLCSLSL